MLFARTTNILIKKRKNKKQLKVNLSDYEPTESLMVNTKPVVTVGVSSNSFNALKYVKLYNFCKVKYLSEEEFFEQFRKFCFYIDSRSKNHKVNIDTSRLINHFLIVPKIWNYYIPMIDCDSIEDKNSAISELDYLHLKYRVLQSTETHFWVFVDKLDNFKNVINFLEGMPGDYRYPWCSKKRGEIVIRCIPKNYYIPSEIKIKDNFEFSIDFKYWTDQFISYWKSDLINWFITRKIVSNI